MVNNGQPRAENPNLNRAASHILVTLCKTATRNISFDPKVPALSTTLESLMRIVILGEAHGGKLTALPATTSVPGSTSALIAVAQVCQEAEQLEAGAQLSQLVHKILFACHVQRRKLDEQKAGRRDTSRWAIFREMVKSAEVAGVQIMDEFGLNRFYNAGAKACLLAGAGE